MSPLHAVVGEVAGVPQIPRKAGRRLAARSERGATPAPTQPLGCRATSCTPGRGEKPSPAKTLGKDIIPVPSGITFLQRNGGCCSNIAKESFFFFCSLSLFFFLTNCCKEFLKKQISIQNIWSFPYSERNCQKRPPGDREASPWGKRGDVSPTDSKARLEVLEVGAASDCHSSRRAAPSSLQASALQTSREQIIHFFSCIW